MMTKHIYYTIVVMVLCTVSASAQWITGSSSFNSSAEMLSATFRSTSAMQGSNSTYASSPSIETDDAAALNASAHSSGPRRVGPPTPGGDPTPVGDAVLPLLLMAGGYLLIRRRKRTAVTD